MTIRTLLILIILISGSSALGESIDRAGMHEKRLAGLDLTLRDAALDVTRTQIGTALSFSDVPVSGSILPAMFDQANGSIVPLADGGWLGIWDDERHGSRKLFWQRYSNSFVPIGSNELVAVSDIGTDLVEPQLAVDTMGRVYLAYRDRTLGLIMARRYNADLTPDLGLFLVNDTSFSSFAGPFELAVFPNGRMVIAWENYTLAGSSIAVRIYNSAGSSVYATGAVNDDGPGSQHWVPTVAVQPGAGCLVTWEDYRNGRADIYGQLLAGDGTPIGSNFAFVIPGPDAEPQIMPKSTYSSIDDYVVVWTDQRLGMDIVAQRFNAITGLVGSNVLLSADDTLVLNQDPDITTFSDGRNLITWAALGAENSILRLPLGPNLAPIGSARISNTAALGRRWAPAAAISKNDSYGIIWTEFQDEDADILFMPFDAIGDPALVNELMLNDDTEGAPSITPKVISSTDWVDLVVWQDGRNDAGDIYLRAVSNAGYFTAAETRVNQDSGPTLQTEPITAVSDSKALTVWIDSRPLGGLSGQRIYGRFCSLTRVFTEDEFIISDTLQASIKGRPAIAMAGDGQALVVWIDKRSGTMQVWGRWLNAAGGFDSNEFSLSSIATDLEITNLYAGVDPLGQFRVAWFDCGLPQTRITVKQFDSDKQEQGSFVWSSSVTDVEISEIAVDFGSDGSTYLGWIGTDDGSVYLTSLDLSGSEIIAPLVVNDDVRFNVESPTISISENDDIGLAWTQSRQVLYQVFNSSLTRIGSNDVVTSADPEFMLTPHIDASRGRAWVVWSDPRVNGLGIYASAILFDPTDVDDPSGNLPDGYALDQNYPNPFNPTTTIEFTVPQTSDVTLDVYNMLGQKVTTLASGQFPAGTHRVNWDGGTRTESKVASGVYFYRLETDRFSQTRKMILLK